MSHSLNLRDIGEARKSALKAEAEERGVSVSELVRLWIDDGLERARAERAKATWLAQAQPGLADEVRHLEDNSPTLARYRRYRRR